MPVGLIVAVAGLVLVSACDGPRDRQRADGPAPTASTAPPPTTTAAARACLREDEAAAVFRFPTSDGASLAGVIWAADRPGWSWATSSPGAAESREPPVRIANSLALQLPARWK